MEVKIKEIIGRYGTERQYILAIMQDMQEEFRYVPREGLEAIAERFNCSVGELYALCTFYKALSLSPKGRYSIKVCAGTTCHIRGGENIRDGLARELGIGLGETTPDGLFTLEEVHCVGACALGPIVMVDDDLYGNVTLEKLPDILDKYRDSEAEGAVSGCKEGGDKNE